MEIFRCSCMTRALIAVVGLLSIATLTHAGGGSENVVVVVNQDSWASLAIANEYVQLRSIPPANVIYLKHLPDFEQVDLRAFRQAILKPVLDTIEQRGLAEQIDYIAYSSDIPCAVDIRSMLPKDMPKHVTPVASITGATYLSDLILKGDPAFADLNVNRYMRRPLTRRHPPVQVTSEDEIIFGNVSLLMRDLQWQESNGLLSDLLKRYPHEASLHYQLAVCQVHLNKLAQAIDSLNDAAESGFLNFRHLETAPHFRVLCEEDAFQDLLKRMRSTPFSVQPTRGFSHAYRWDAAGNVTDTDGHKYLLSTVLAVTSGRGNSVREAVESHRRSAAADFSRPGGTIYFMTNDNVRSEIRDWMFPAVVAQLSKLGVRGEIIAGTLPAGKTDVLGLMTGTSNFDWDAARSVILPGAICEHLTSTGGVLRETGHQTPLTDFIRAGAAGASGAVTEPYAIPEKFPSAHIHVHYARGCSLAESFYQSVAGPYQLLIVGDPLCRPWAEPPSPILEGIEPGATVQGVVTLQLRQHEGDKSRIAKYEIYLDGKFYRPSFTRKSFGFDTTKVGDGYHELRLVAVAAGMIETRGQTVLPFNVSNHDRLAMISIPLEVPHLLDQPLTVTAEARGACRIEIQHNARILTTIQGERGQATIDPRVLGLGSIRLQAVGYWEEGATGPVASTPCFLQIDAPTPLPALDIKFADTLEPGLLFTRDDATPLVIQHTRGGWLSKSGGMPGEQFELVGYFQVPIEDVYQFQVRSNADPEIHVDGKLLGQPVDKAWHLLPIPLQAGWHKLRIIGRIRVNPELELRFGGPGAISVASDCFQHFRGTSDRAP